MMKNLRIKDLKSIRANFDALMERKINEAKNKQAVNSISRMPLYKLKNIFEGIVKKVYESKDGKKDIGRYIKAIKGSKELNEMYCILETINKKEISENVDSSLFLNECIALSERIDQKKYEHSLNELRKVIKECVTRLSLDASTIEELSEGDKKEIDESIHYILSNKKNTKILGEYLSNFSKVSNYINETRKVETEKPVVTENVSLDELVTENMEEWEKEAIEKISLNSLSGKDDSFLFETYKNECINMIEESLTDEEIENRAHLETMKMQLESKAYNSDTFVDDILKLSELKKTLE